MENNLNVLQTGGHRSQRLHTFPRIGIDGEECGSHAFGDSADLVENGRPMSEDNEDVLVCFFFSDGVLEWLVDIRVIHVEIPAEKTPKDSFEGCDACPRDRSSDKSAIWR